MGATKTGKKMRNWFASVGAKVEILLLAALVVSLAAVIIFSSVRVSNEINSVNKNYIHDLSKAYGEEVKGKYDMIDGYLKNYDSLANMLGEVKVEGCDSSYAYVVDRQGIMCYHPTQDKVGAPVENAVVKGLVEEIATGKKGCGTSTTDVVEYTYNGSAKFAGYYVAPCGEFILVVTVDKSDVNRELTSTIATTIIIGVVLLILVFMACFFLCRKMFRPLTESAEALNRLADYDLAPVKRINSNDEIGDISRGTYAVRENLHAMVESINSIASELDGNATNFISTFKNISEHLDNVDKSVLEIAEGATSQAQETASSSEQVIGINTEIENNNTTVDLLKASAIDMNRVANEAITELEALVETCDKQKDSIKVLADQTMMTNDSAKKIGDAVNMITSIASQTNLLSLNASIEAARAGEAGRGFAVVAEEIRQLSENSRQSADIIQDIITELIKNSQVSVDTITEVETNTEEQLSKLSATQDSFNELLAEIKSVDSNTDNVSEGTNRLSELNHGISASIQQLSAISQQYAATTEETSANMQSVNSEVEGCMEMTKGLKDLSSNLVDQVSKFKL